MFSIANVRIILINATILLSFFVKMVVFRQINKVYAARLPVFA